MSIVLDVAEAIKFAAEGVDQICTVATAVREGSAFLQIRHPDLRPDLVAMCVELKGTSTAIAVASAILTHFRFTAAGAMLDRQPERFNDHLLAHKAKVELVSRSLQAMRGRGHLLRRYLSRLQRRAEELHLERLVSLFGLDSASRDRELTSALTRICDEEIHGRRLVVQLSVALQEALTLVAHSLGPPEAMSRENVPRAAALLGEYADAFSILETRSNYLTLELQQAIDALEAYLPAGEPSKELASLSAE